MSAVNVQRSTIGILVLEDNLIHRELLKDEFQDPKYAIESAGDAQTAIHLIRADEANFQVGIFDLKVPRDVSGVPEMDAALEVIEEARRKFPDMIVITISSVFVNEKTQARLTAAKASRNFPKPFYITELHQFVDSCSH